MQREAPRQIALNVGEIVISSTPSVVTTVLGSCISVFIYSSKDGIGGVNHFALPAPGGESRGSCMDELRYGNISIPRLIEGVLDAGASREDLRAKILGGAAVDGRGGIGGKVGSENVAAARRSLARAGIPLIGEDVGGVFGRKVLFYTDSGRVRVLALARADGRKSSSGNLHRMAHQVAKTDEVDKSVKVNACVTTRMIDEAKKRVFIVDDSKTMRDLLTAVLSKDPGLEVVGSAENAQGAELAIQRMNPDVVTLDIHMPGMDGVTLLGRLMANRPLPVVMITAMSHEDGDAVLTALEIGAVDYIQKPKMTELSLVAPFICEKVKAAASARVMRLGHPVVARPKISRPRAKTQTSSLRQDRRVIAIGASTGGTEAIKDVLLGLPEDIPAIVIVQHIPPVFSRAFADRLNDLCPFTVKEAASGDALLPGLVLIAPGGRQMLVESSGTSLRVKVTDDPPVNRHKPSVDVLFESVARAARWGATGVILTGMGGDGARGLLKMKEAGQPTIAQNEESCVVFGMPKEAIKLAAADVVCPLNEVARKLTQWMKLNRAA